VADPDTFAEAGHADAAGWVLGVLDPEESGRFVQLADGPEPPPDLQARTLDRVQRAARKAAWRRWSPRGTLSAAAAAVVAAVAAVADPRAFPVMEITTEVAGDAGQHGEVLLSGTA
jgi:hypothetical protein